MTATATTSVPNAARSVRDEWRRLSTSALDPPNFRPEMVASLPEPARRWLTHAIAPGTPLYGSVELTMRGEIRLGTWRPFTARQILRPPDGFIWAATARVAGLPVVGYDRFSAGTGEMRWRLLGLIPVMSARGSDVTRSAAGRLAAEGIWIPTSFHRAQWSAGPTPDAAIATWRMGGATEVVQLHVGDHGQLTGVLEQRWGNPNGEPFQRYPFGVTIEHERAVAGVTIPSVLRAGWWWGSERQQEGEFFRARVVDAVFR